MCKIISELNFWQFVLGNPMSSISNEVGTTFHVWNRVPSGTWDRLRGGTLSQVQEHPPFHVWGHTLGGCQVRWVPHFMSEIGYPLGPEIGWDGYPISGLGAFPISCLGVHPISGLGGCQVRWVLHFMSEIGYPLEPEIGWEGVPYLRSGSILHFMSGGAPYLTSGRVSSEVGTLFHVWGRVPSRTWDRLRGVSYLRSGTVPHFMSGVHPISGLGGCQVRWVPHFISDIGYPPGPEIGYPSWIWDMSGWQSSPISCLGAHPMLCEGGTLSDLQDIIFYFFYYFSLQLWLHSRWKKLPRYNNVWIMEKL